MKHMPTILVIAIFLLSCQLPVSTTQTLSDADMATEVAKVLASMPTETRLPQPQATIDMIYTPVENIPAPSTTANQTPVVISLTPTQEPTLIPPTETITPAFPTSILLPTITPVPNTISPTPTFSTNDPRNILGPPTSADPMDIADFWAWPVGPDKFTDASFTGAYMRLTGLTSKSGWRMPATLPGDNYYTEIIARPEKCSGRDNYGIIFRVPDSKTPAQGYLFSISCDGAYKLWMWDGLVDADGKAKMLLNWRSSDTIRKGFEQPNRIGVQVIGNTFTFYINGYWVDEHVDSTFSTGGFGVFVDAVDTDKLTIDIDEVVYWKK